MAITATVIRQSAREFIADITATLDADVGPINVNHLLGSVPLEVTVTPLLAVAHTSAWAVTGISATQVSLTKANAVGSGDADPQLRLVARLDPYRER